MLDICLITVIYKRISKFWYITQAVNEDIFVKNLQGGTFGFAHLFLQIYDSHIRMQIFELILSQE
jgi:hypothetical protein